MRPDEDCPQPDPSVNARAPRVLIGAAARRAVFLPLLRNVRAINASLGPDGRALLYEATPGGVGLARDGLTIAIEMAENEGARSIGPRILKETLFASQRDLGDGAARLACIFGAILEQGARFVAAGYPPQQLADEILRAGRASEERLAEERCATPDLKAMANVVATDATLAEVVAAGIAHAGVHGIVDVKERPGDGADLEVGNGFSIDAVLPSEHLGADAPATVLELDDVFVLVANEVVSDFGRLGPILEGFASRKKSLAIVARDVTGAALEALVRNRRELGLHIVALRPTDVSARAGEVLEDLAFATAASLIGAEVGRDLGSARPAMLGRARRLRFARGRALFIDPSGDRTAIEQRRALLAAEAERVRYLSYDREHALRRSARLAGAWSEIRVGGRTTFDASVRLIETRAAVATLQAALRSGVVAGGGGALVREAARLQAEASGPATTERAARRCVAVGLRGG